MTSPPVPPPDWQEYLAAAQSLDALRRAQAVAAAAATRAVSSTRAELARVRTELERQRAALAREAQRHGVTPPPLEPSADEQSHAAAEAGDPESVPAVLQRCRQLAASAEAALHRRAPRWWPRKRPRSGVEDQ